MRVMVCGGAGFIGSHLCERLLAEGNEVDAVDDLSTGSIPNLAACRAATGRFKLQNVAVESAEFAELVSVRRPEIIFNLVPLSPSQCHVTGGLASVTSAVAVLEAARLAGTAKVVACIPAGLLYGEVKAKELPVKEDHESRPRNAPAVFARAIADLHSVYRDRHGIEFTVLATANVYGPRQRAQDGVVAAFVEALDNGKPPLLHGTGKQTRDFVHVDDAVDALVRAVDRGAGLTLNIGTGVATSVRDLWGLMAGESGLAPRAGSPRPDDLTRMSLSPVRARIQLGWAPFTKLRDGLRTLR